MDDAELSPRQRALLAEAQRDPSEIISNLRFLIEADEPLSPLWIDLWEAAKGGLTRRYPASVLRNIEDALAKVVRGPDKEIFDLRPSQDATVTLLLGAGASAPEPSAIPTVAYLLPELWRRAKKMGREDIDGLAAWCSTQGITNIEDLLTAAYVANYAAKNPNISGLLDYFLFAGGRNADELALRRIRSGRPMIDSASIALVQDTLQILFGLLAGIMIPAKPNRGHEAIVTFAKAHPRTSIVTTNYDGCIDEALTRAKVPVDTHVNESESPPSGHPCLDLIKMHGSINWTYCDSCQEVKQFDLLRMKKDYDDDTASYAVISICRACGGQRRPLLVPPMAFKFILFPNLIGLWNLARERIEGADYLIVVGHSFSEADAYISKIITRSLTVNDKQQMIVVDPSSKLVPTLRERFAAHIDGFDPKRVLRAVGSADELLPDILASLVSAEVPAPVEVAHSHPNGAPSEATATSVVVQQ